MAVIDQSWLLIGPPATHLLVTGHGVMAEVGAPGDELRGVRGDPEHILHPDWLAGSCLLIGQSVTTLSSYRSRITSHDSLFLIEISSENKRVMYIG